MGRLGRLFDVVTADCLMLYIVRGSLHVFSLAGGRATGERLQLGLDLSWLGAGFQRRGTCSVVVADRCRSSLPRGEDSSALTCEAHPGAELAQPGANFQWLQSLQRSVTSPAEDEHPQEPAEGGGRRGVRLRQRLSHSSGWVADCLAALPAWMPACSLARWF